MHTFKNFSKKNDDFVKMKIFAYFAAINVAILASLTKAQTSEKLVSELVQSGPKWTQENPKLLHVEPLGSMVRNFWLELRKYSEI